MNQPIQTVLFDLDGTLLDTAPDLVLALNTLLIEHQQQPLPLAQIRPWISLGTTALIRKGFNLDINDPFQLEIHELFNSNNKIN